MPLETDVDTDRQGCRTVRWLPPGSTRWEESGEEKLKEALLAQEVGKEALLVQGEVREALQQLKTRAHKSAEEGDQEGRRSGEGNVGNAEEGGVRMQDDIAGGNSKQIWQESRVKKESQTNPDPRGHGVKKMPLDIEVRAGLPLKKLKRDVICELVRMNLLRTPFCLMTEAHYQLPMKACLLMKLPLKAQKLRVERKEAKLYQRKLERGVGK